jgi:hypothetical protein
MDQVIQYAILFSASMFLGMLAFLLAGHYLGKRRLAKSAEDLAKGVGPVDGAVFALFGLLLAFTFSGAASRFDERRDLVVQEANAIGTAYLRVDLLPPAAQPQLRTLFRQYLESRLATYRKLPDLAGAMSDYNRSLQMQNEIWSLSVAAASADGNPGVISLVLSSLNDMIDITTTRLAASRKHPPLAIFAMLLALGFAASLLAGYGMADCRKRPWLHMLAFAAVTTMTVYVILDMEYPRLGLIRVDKYDQLLVDVLQGMK